MKETLLSLLKLAEIDSKIDQVLEDREEIPDTVKDISGDIIALQQDIDTIQGELAELLEKQKEVTEAIKERAEWATEREARINEIKTNKEYQAAVREISLAKKTVKEKETELETLNPQIEEKTQEASKVTEENQPKIDEFKNTINELKTKFDSIKEVLATEKTTREEVAKTIDNKQMLAYYEKIHVRVTPAMAKAESGICTECGTKVLPQIFNQLAVAKTLHSCNGCKRILYLDETLNGE